MSANGATFSSPATITAAAQASSTVGIKSVVLFLVGSDVPKTVLTAPYTATWQSMPAGTYAMYALATDKAGVTTRSTAIEIVNQPPPSEFNTLYPSVPLTVSTDADGMSLATSI